MGMNVNGSMFHRFFPSFFVDLTLSTLMGLSLTNL
jgi:hypothetical protein